MQIALITPARPTARSGNRNTATRWARFLRQLGHRVRVQEKWDGHQGDLMIALHARRSYASIKRFSDLYPHRPLVVVLTGTDLYRDIRTDIAAQESLRLATLLVVLQDLGVVELAQQLQTKTRTIYQSAPSMQAGKSGIKYFDVCLMGHLREEKDPFRTALAMRYLPRSSRIRSIHMGSAIDPEMAAEARRLMAAESRYNWLGELPRWQARQKLARCRLLVLSSRMEGGANVICEALSAGVPVIASNVPGNVGMLGQDYAGYYPVEDEVALAGLLDRAERDAAFYQLLKRQCSERAKLMTPGKEMEALRKLIAEAEAISKMAF
jgi:putative glycosyltransferase (TIGR04348 family)